MTPATRYFFAYANSKDPAAVSELIANLAAGRQLNAARVPVALLAPVVLLTAVGLREYEQQIVDDYPALLARQILGEDMHIGGWVSDAFNRTIDPAQGVCLAGWLVEEA